jgi:hypothetical protein
MTDRQLQDYCDNNDNPIINAVRVLPNGDGRPFAKIFCPGEPRDKWSDPLPLDSPSFGYLSAGPNRHLPIALVDDNEPRLWPDNFRQPIAFQDWSERERHKAPR